MAFTSSFILPTFDTLSGENIILDDFQENAYRQLMFNVLESDIVRMYEDRYVINGLVHYVSKYLTNKCIIINPLNNSSHIIRLIYANPDMENTYLVRIAFNLDTFIDVLSYFISSNLSTSGVFTELWEPLNELMFKVLGDPFNDAFFFVRNNNNNHENLDIYDRLYEEHRNSVIEETFKEDKNHNVTVMSEEKMVDENDENKECHLCYSESKYVCSKCSYPLCQSCVDHVKRSTGECPCCRCYPLKLIKINKILLDRNEPTEGTKQ